jgi:hypothetical protein
MWLNALIDKLDPLRRQAPAGTPARPSPSAPPPG